VNRLKANILTVLTRSLIIAVIFFILDSWACAAPPDLVIFHTNDVHGYALEEKDAKGKLTRLGYDRLKAAVDAEKAPRKLLLDAGDVLHGQAFATARRGELAALMLSMVGYDALAVGNHDFDYGRDRLIELIAKYRLNFLAANIVSTDPKHPFSLPKGLIKDFGDFKVGIFGLSTPETVTSTDPKNTRGLNFQDPIIAAREMVRLLKQDGADMIIALTHMGSEPYCQPMSQTIAAEVPGIDVIIDGHSHSKTAVRIKGPNNRETIIVSTGSGLENLGRLRVNRKKKGGFDFSPEIIPAARLTGLVPDPAAHEALTALKKDLDRELSQVVLTLPFDLEGHRDKVRSQPTNLGRLICAALTEETGADAAILNGGSIRDSIAKGEVTKGELLSVLPYGNYVYLIDITGSDLISALNYGLGRPGSGSFPQFWGLEVVTEKTVLTGTDGSKKEAQAVVSVKIKGQEVKPEAKYVLAINDFLKSGGDGYDVFTKYAYRESATLEELFRTFVTKTSGAKLKAIAETENLKDSGK
jgi:5'-nucleotidase